MHARRLDSLRLGATLAVAGTLALAGGPTATRGDEPSRVGRIFRLGAGLKPGPAATPPRPAEPLAPPPPAPTTAAVGSSGAPPRLVPQPRVNRPATEADPLVTRVALGRTDDGKQFGMFLQVYADGTVIDSEGVHRVGPDLLRPIVQAIQSGELGRMKGHCGGPATDFIESSHLVVYERSMGRLRANAFSYSGNPQGCDPAIRQLQASLEAVLAKISPTPTSAPAPSAAPVASSPAPTSSEPIPLTFP